MQTSEARGLRRLEFDPWRAGVILRASKTLSSSTWGGYRYRVRHQDSNAVLGYLRTARVRYVVVDRSAAEQPHVRLLDEALRASGGEYREAARFDILRSRSRRAPVEIHVNTRETQNPERLEVPGRNGETWVHQMKR